MAPRPPNHLSQRFSLGVGLEMQGCDHDPKSAPGDQILVELNHLFEQCKISKPKRKHLDPFHTIKRMQVGEDAVMHRLNKQGQHSHNSLLSQLEGLSNEDLNELWWTDLAEKENRHESCDQLSEETLSYAMARWLREPEEDTFFHNVAEVSYPLGNLSTCPGGCRGTKSQETLANYSPTTRGSRDFIWDI